MNNVVFSEVFILDDSEDPPRPKSDPDPKCLSLKIVIARDPSPGIPGELLPREILPVPTYPNALCSLEADPEILKSCMDSGGFDPIDSVVLENPKSDPEPICGAGVMDSVVLPENLNRTLVSSGDTAVDSVLLMKVKSDPEPT